MFWTTTTQLMVIGTAAFCISFSVIYTLIYCYKSRRKENSEETEILRDELLKHKFANQRSPSLTSPPSIQPIINPNYNVSPLKIPTRHLRSTSASYSPTHYLSPHHRRNSTPTHPSCQNTFCHHEHPVTKPAKSTSSVSSSGSLASISIQSVTNLSPNINILCTQNNQANAINSYNKSTKKTKPIPSKLVSSNSWDNQKSFSFGPIPARKSGRARNTNILNEKQSLISSQPEKFALEDNESSDDWDSKSRKKVVHYSTDPNCITNCKRKHYTPDLFSKEHIVLEEIPYYTNVEEMSCNYN